MTTYELCTGDSLEVLRGLPDNSVDSLVSDPPAGIAFMGKEWDTDKGGKHQWVAWFTEIMLEAYRVLKPGAHGLLWSLPKTSFWTAWALDEAGFEIRDNIVNHINGQGFPKGQNISKAIDKQAGAECEVVTAPATEEAEEWDGWGTTLKPSQEIWWLVRKPLSGNTIAANVLKWGVGALNIDAVRIGTGGEILTGGGGKLWSHYRDGTEEKAQPKVNTSGRWPSNVMFQHIEGEPCPDCEDDPDCETCYGTGEVGGCRRVGTKRVASHNPDNKDPKIDTSFVSCYGGQRARGVVGHADLDGKETVEDWDCAPGCPVAQLDGQSGISTSSGGQVVGAFRDSYSHAVYGRGSDERHRGDPGLGDSGGASRFYYCPKASSKERHFYCATCDGVYPRSRIRRHQKHDVFQHPTQKPLKLMQYLIRMVTPEGGTVLDPFMGTGTTGVAAREEGLNFIGIDMDPRAVRIAQARMDQEAPPPEPIVEKPPEERRTVKLWGKK